MRKFLLPALFLLTTIAFAADVKISQLPAGTASLTTSIDIFPFVNMTSGTTEKMTIYDIKNIPNIVSTYAPLASPTFTGNVTFTGTSNVVSTISSGLWNGTPIGISYGGTGATTANAGFNALSPMTALGDIIYGSTGGAANNLAGNTSATKMFLSQTGTGSVSASPHWAQPICANIADSSASCATDATNASNISSGTLSGARLPNPSSSVLGGVESYAAVSHQWINQISTGGVPSSTQPAFSDLSGVATGAQLPNPTSGTLGGVESYAAVSHQWINQISTSGVPSSTQPTYSDISGTNGVAGGGTGANTLTAHGVLLGEGTSPIAATSAGTTGYPLLSGGASADPAFAQLNLTVGVTNTLPVANGGTGVTSSTGTGSVVLSASPTLTGTIGAAAMTLSTPLGFASGGTNGATAAAGFNNLNPMTTTGDIIYESGTNTAARLPIGTSNQVLSVVAGVPSWVTIPGASFTAPQVTEINSQGTQTGWLFTISTSSTVAVGDTYTNNSNTYTVQGALSAQSGQVLWMSGTGATSGTTLTRATGAGTSSITFSATLATATYTPPGGALYIDVEAVGGGGGGGSSASANGTAGTATLIGPNIITCNGGGGGQANGAAIANGGTASVTTSSTVLRQKTFAGGGVSGSGGSTVPGGMGSSSPFGGAGSGGATGGATGTSAQSNTGSGGGGGGGNSTNGYNGTGGLAGGYAMAKFVTTILSSYPYVLGQHGTGGTAGTGGAGGNGADGKIVFTPYFQ